MMKNLLILTFLSSLLGCNYNYTKKNALNQSGSPQKEIQLESVEDFDLVKTQVIEKKCLSCHSNNTGNQGNLNLETYANVKSSSDRIYYRSIELKNMPSNSALSTSEYSALKNWLEAGAPEKANGQKIINLNGKNLNWNFIKSEILMSRCLECHSEPQPIANLDFEKYEIFKTQITKIFEKVVLPKDSQAALLDMPHQSLSATEKQALLKWISIGMPQ
jgi:uncharacterized membrane protein